jgi:hypothetical protein
MLWICMREIQGSNPLRDTSYNRHFRSFSIFSQANVGIVPEIGHDHFFLMYFQVYMR